MLSVSDLNTDTVCKTPPAVPNSSPPFVATFIACPAVPVPILNVAGLNVSSYNILSFAFVLELSVPSNTKASPEFEPLPSVPFNKIDSELFALNPRIESVDNSVEPTALFGIFAEVTFRNFGFFLGADQIVQNSVPAIVFLQVPFAIASGTMLRTTLIYDFFKNKGKKIINIISYVIGIMLFIGIAVGGWTDMIKGWEIGEYQGIGAIEFPVYPIRTVIIFSSIIVVFIYISLIINSFTQKK